MPYIYLGATYGSYPLWGDVKVTVSDELFGESNLFRKYKHQLKTPTGGNIYVYKQSHYIAWYNYATLQPGDAEYKNAKLEKADVYFNRFDTAKPLVLVLHFEKEEAPGVENGGGGSNGKIEDKYWKYSEFSSQINRSANMPISSLKKFEESKFLQELIKENDLTNDSLTYDLHETGNGGGSSIPNYREDKISVSKQDVNGGGTAKFYKHRHSPKSPPIVRKSYMLYNKNVLMKSSDRALDGIQGQNYTSITVYFSKDDNKPLLIELENVGSKTYLKRIIGGGGDKFFWAVDARAALKFGTGGDNKVVEHLEQIVISLDNRIYVILNEQEPYKKSDLKGLKGSDDKTVELSKYQPSEIRVEEEELTGTEPESEGQQPESKYKKYTHTIEVNLNSSELAGFPPDARRDVTLELVPSIPNVMIPMHESGRPGKKAKLTFKQNGSTTLSTELHVYFYNHTGTGDGTDSSTSNPDKVPLMLEHDKTFYAPKDSGTYFTGWEKIDKITGGYTGSITDKLNEINKALNEVNINQTGAYGISDPQGEDQLADFSTDRINVECKSVGGNTGDGTCSPSPPGAPGPNGCTPSPYTKYIHSTVNKFQLGAIKYKGQDVKYVGEDGGQRNGGKAIDVQPGQNLVEVYYLTSDMDRKYPLLIGVGKQPGTGGGGQVDQYYKLKTTGGKPGTASGYMWQQDSRASSQMRPPNNLVKYLNEINYNVKKVLKIELQHNTPGHKYDLQLSKQPGQARDFTQIGNGVGTTGNKQITVEDCNSQCASLGHYKCFKHKITELGPELNEVGGIALTLPGVGRDKVVEIQLHNSSEGTCQNGNSETTQLFYNKCMGDVYVFFYNKGGSTGGLGGSTDTVPLMLFYNGKYYKPCDREKYFKKWVCVKGIGGASDKPCGKDGGVTLAGQLDIVNRELNVIDLFDIKDGKGKTSNYGLPDKQAGREFSTERVTVKTQTPKSPYASTTYVKVVHRTTNGFQIGDIKYNTQEITGHGITAGAHFNVGENGPNGGNNHKSQVTQHKWNTVVAYYSGTDTQKKLPQLIVILKTDNEANERTPVTGATDKKEYGYYILSKGTGGSGYEYKWVPVTELPPKSVTLDDATDFKLLNSVVILLEKQDKNGYNDGQIQKAISTAIQQQSSIKSPGQSGNDVNRIQGAGKRITVNDATQRDAKCVKDYGYKVYQHDFGTMAAREGQLKQLPLTDIDLILGVRLLIPSMNNGSTGDNGQTQYKQLTLSESGASVGPSGTHYLYYKGSHNQLYVYFYGGLDGDDGANGTTRDQRPLLLCYDSKAYKPSSCKDYDTTWTWATSINSCDCKDRSGNTQLLDALTSVVGFLNKVNLFNRPGGGGGCNGATGGATTTCNGDSSSNGSNTCTYTVHTYQGKKIEVRVTCSKIESSDGATSTQGCYYMSMTHTPNGMNGDSGPSTNGAPGYRLGQVTYTGTTSSPSTGGNKVNYTLTGNNRWNPLISVTTYYYSEDTGFTKPLLVVLDFKRSPGPPPGPASTDGLVKEYYKLKSSGDSSSGLSWSIDGGAEARLKGTEGRVDNTKLIAYLDSIRFGLMKVVQIIISSTREYDFKTQAGTDRGGGGFRAPNGVGNGAGTAKQIKVQECQGPQCDPLTKGNYKCFQHKLVEAIKDKLENMVGGIKLTIPGSKGDVEIPLHKKKDGAGAGGGDGADGSTHTTEYERITPLTYNKCMGDIYVFFYQGTETDKIPLMLVYNNNYYRPNTRDDYFSRWIPVPELKFGGDGKACGEEPNGKTLVEKLDEVNRELNRIELDNENVKRGSGGYGLPKSPPTNPGAFPTERVTVVERAPSDKPGADSAKSTYTRIVHRTVNGFTVGALTSGGKDITSAGLEVKGAATIRVNGGSGGRTNGNHTVYTNTNKLNTVVVYYAKKDVGYKLPQLMVLLNTDNAIGSGQGAVTGSTKTTKYGYYIISISNDFCSYYEYQWRDVKKPEKPLKLDDETDFSLLNSIVILLEKISNNGNKENGKYGDKEIKAAIQSVGTKSPGNKNGINRLENKNIVLKNETKTEGKCLDGTGFKLITHNIASIVTIEGSLKDKLNGVTLIGGLRFLIPTHEKDVYKQMKLYDEQTKGFEVIRYHQSGQNIVNVFFYGEDPRPLLLCYNETAYKPTSKGNYFSKWYKDEKISKCECQKPCEELLKELVNVSNFLNPLDIKIVPKYPNGCQIYYVHWFNGKGIKIKVECKPIKDESFCYIGLIHTHLGTSMCDCKGFRLGNIEYGCECIQDKDKASPPNDPCISSSHEDGKYTPSPEVVTYYYKGDKKYKNPLLVALCKKAGGEGGKYQPYYELQKSTGGAGDVKKYKKQDGPIDLQEKVGSELAQKLDEILFNISQRLQVILDQRPMAKIKCIEIDVIKSGQPINGEKEKINYPCGCVKKEEPAKHPPDKEGVIPPSYVAKLYPPTEDSKVSNGSKTTHVVVEEVRKCKELASRGYRCFVHKLTEVSGIEEVGGLKLFLWKGEGDKNGHKIQLCNGPSGSKENNGKSDVTYNTCKGNLYVYFYGEDPRPLMLCYDGKGYKPRSCKDYEKSWVCEKTITNCKCGEPEFDATQVLQKLYDVSMFLNEVDLGQTKSAYEPSKSGKAHTYQVHKYNNTEVRVSVTSTDLSCYKQYTHRPEKGYRLGNICYNPDQSSSTASPPGGKCKEECKQEHGIKYSESKQLISVSLYYYMYDKEHKWPLIVELGYKGELSDFYRLDDHRKGSEKWEKMDGKTGSCAKNGENGPPSPNGKSEEEKKKKEEERKNTCDLDKEFAKQAEELQLQIYNAERGIPWDHNRYWYRVVDLEELIERRAYRIRKSLEKSNNLKYEKEKDGESTLILKTDKDCHEESLMGYVIGGGAVGVAGGGGWKAVSVMLESVMIR